jgi:hypothetical protein
VITAVNNAFAVMNPTFAKINLIFPIHTLFKILLMVLFVEMTLFLITLVLKMVTFFKPKIMITIITGKPGAGKTLFMTFKAFEMFLKGL